MNFSANLTTSFRTKKISELEWPCALTLIGLLSGAPIRDEGKPIELLLHQH